MSNDEAARPKRPARLGAAGRALWTRIVDRYELEPREVAVLELACRQADDLARVEGLLARDGMVVEGSQGQPRLSQLVAEARQARLALDRLLGSLALPSEEAGTPRTAASERARKAASRRWGAPPPLYTVDGQG